MSRRRQRLAPGPGSLQIIGIDCATEPAKTGLARAVYRRDRASVREVVRGGPGAPVDEIVSRWLSEGEPSLLALDAPLGWPRALGRSLAGHEAGDPLAVDPNELFRRATDRLVAATLRKTPLDVGADRIARTARAALALLHALRVKTRRPLPLAWRPGRLAKDGAIEVYPAGTLAARGAPSTGYKGPSGRGVREAILGAMGKEVDIAPPLAAAAVASDHVLDAVVCVLAGVDFLERRVIEPGDLRLARKEGFIWVRRPISPAFSDT